LFIYNPLTIAGNSFRLPFGAAMAALEDYHGDASSSLALLDGEAPDDSAFAFGSSPRYEDTHIPVLSAQFSGQPHTSPADARCAAPDVTTDDYWLQLVRARAMHKCTMQEMKAYLKSRKLKSTGCRSKLVQRIELLFASYLPQPQSPRSAFTGAGSASSPGSSSRIRNLESLPRVDVINGFLSGIVSSAEQLELTYEERCEAFM
jgi:hypothetical protein